MKKRITLTPPATSLSNQHENSLFWHSFPLLCVNSLPSAPLALRGVAVTFSTARMRGPRNVVLVRCSFLGSMVHDILGLVRGSGFRTFPTPCLFLLLGLTAKQDIVTPCLASMGGSLSDSPAQDTSILQTPAFKQQTPAEGGLRSLRRSLLVQNFSNQARGACLRP